MTSASYSSYVEVVSHNGSQSMMNVGLGTSVSMAHDRAEALTVTSSMPMDVNALPCSSDFSVPDDVGLDMDLECERAPGSSFELISRLVDAEGLAEVGLVLDDAAVVPDFHLFSELEESKFSKCGEWLQSVSSCRDTTSSLPMKSAVSNNDGSNSHLYRMSATIFDAPELANSQSSANLLRPPLSANTRCENNLPMHTYTHLKGPGNVITPTNPTASSDSITGFYTSMTPSKTQRNCSNPYLSTQEQNPNPNQSVRRYDDVESNNNPHFTNQCASFDPFSSLQLCPISLTGDSCVPNTAPPYVVPIPDCAPTPNMIPCSGSSLFSVISRHPAHSTISGAELVLLGQPHSVAQPQMAHARVFTTGPLPPPPADSPDRLLGIPPGRASILTSVVPNTSVVTTLPTQSDVPGSNKYFIPPMTMLVNNQLCPPLPEVYQTTQTVVTCKKDSPIQTSDLVPSVGSFPPGMHGSNDQPAMYCTGNLLTQQPQPQQHKQQMSPIQQSCSPSVLLTNPLKTTAGNRSRGPPVLTLNSNFCSLPPDVLVEISTPSTKSSAVTQSSPLTHSTKPVTTVVFSARGPLGTTHASSASLDPPPSDIPRPSSTANPPHRSPKTPAPTTTLRYVDNRSITDPTDSTTHTLRHNSAPGLCVNFDSYNGEVCGMRRLTQGPMPPVSGFSLSTHQSDPKSVPMAVSSSPMSSAESLQRLGSMCSMELFPVLISHDRIQNYTHPADCKTTSANNYRRDSSVSPAISPGLNSATSTVQKDSEESVPVLVSVSSTPNTEYPLSQQGQNAERPISKTSANSNCSSSNVTMVSSSSAQAMMFPCSICGDRGTGNHYGVFACEGCKGFFKRTVRKELVYACRGSQHCPIDRRLRTRCQYCRYQKCLSIGMRREAVREERLQQGGGSSSLDSLSLSGDTPEPSYNTSFLSDDRPEGDEPCTSNGPFTVDSDSRSASPTSARSVPSPADPYRTHSQPLFKSGAARLVDLTQLTEALHRVSPPVALEQIVAAERLLAKRRDEWLQCCQVSFAQSGPTVQDGSLIISSTAPRLLEEGRCASSPLHDLIAWSERIPFFKLLPRGTRASLLQSACLELLLAQLVYRLATGSAHNPRLSVGLPPSPANPPDSHTLDYCTPDFALLRSLLQSHVTFTPSGAVDVGSTKSIQSLIHSATTKLRSLHLDPTEMGSLKLIILLNPDANMLSPEHRSCVESARDQIYAGLELHCNRLWPTAPHGRMGRLLLRIPALHLLALQVRQLSTDGTMARLNADVKRLCTRNTTYTAPNQETLIT